MTQVSIRRRGERIPGYKRHPGSVWIEEHRADLPNDTWIAADENGLVAKSHSIDGVLAEVEAEGKAPADVTIAFITKASR